MEHFKGTVVQQCYCTRQPRRTSLTSNSFCTSTNFLCRLVFLSMRLRGSHCWISKETLSAASQPLPAFVLLFSHFVILGDWHRVIRHPHHVCSICIFSPLWYDLRSCQEWNLSCHACHNVSFPLGGDPWDSEAFTRVTATSKNPQLRCTALLRVEKTKATETRKFFFLRRHGCISLTAPVSLGRRNTLK